VNRWTHRALLRRSSRMDSQRLISKSPSREIGFEVHCGRRLARGFFPLNPIAAEFGSNYDVPVTISATNQKIEEAIAEAREW